MMIAIVYYSSSLYRCNTRSKFALLKVTQRHLFPEKIKLAFPQTLAMIALLRVFVPPYKVLVLRSVSSLPDFQRRAVQFSRCSAEVTRNPRHSCNHGVISARLAI